jgi:hypothetical protein
MNHERPPPVDDTSDRGYEQRDVNARAILWLFAGVAAAVLIAVVGLWFGWQWLEREARRLDPIVSPLATSPVEPPAPRLQAMPLADYQAFRAREEQHLASYGWIDRERGMAHIPIDRAITLLVERGEPRIEQPQTQPNTPNPPAPRR